MIVCDNKFPPIRAMAIFPSGSSSREVRIRVPFLFSVVYFSRGTLPKKGAKGHYWDLAWLAKPCKTSAGVYVARRDFLAETLVVWGMKRNGISFKETRGHSNSSPAHRTSKIRLNFEF